MNKTIFPNVPSPSVPQKVHTLSYIEKHTCLGNSIPTPAPPPSPPTKCSKLDRITEEGLFSYPTSSRQSSPNIRGRYVFCRIMLGAKLTFGASWRIEDRICAKFALTEGLMLLSPGNPRELVEFGSRNHPQGRNICCFLSLLLKIPGLIAPNILR